MRDDYSKRIDGRRVRKLRGGDEGRLLIEKMRAEKDSESRLMSQDPWSDYIFMILTGVR